MVVTIPIIASTATTIFLAALVVFTAYWILKFVITAILGG